jgi:hypothetical protein
MYTSTSALFGTHMNQSFHIDVYRFLNGFPTKNEIILLHATNNGTLLYDSH